LAIYTHCKIFSGSKTRLGIKRHSVQVPVRYKRNTTTIGLFLATNQHMGTSGMTTRKRKATLLLAEETAQEAAAAIGAAISPFHSVDIIKQILLFVGNNQYRFVAAINKDFHTVYLQLYSNNTQTYFNISTQNHIEICATESQSAERLNGTLCTLAARHGNLSALQYLQGNHFEWSEKTCAIAAKYGHLHILQYARANGCPWDSNTCSNAVENGHMAILEWASANECPMDVSICCLAAANGHLEILQWARAHGFDWSRYTRMVTWQFSNGL
jgi:hypothetical protein